MLIAKHTISLQIIIVFVGRIIFLIRIEKINFLNFLKIINYYSLPDNSGVNRVEPLEMDTPRNKRKCPSYGGVRLIKVFQNFHITVHVTFQIPVCAK